MTRDLPEPRPAAYAPRHSRRSVCDDVNARRIGEAWIALALGKRRELGRSHQYRRELHYMLARGTIATASRAARAELGPTPTLGA